MRHISILISAVMLALLPACDSIQQEIVFEKEAVIAHPQILDHSWLANANRIWTNKDGHMLAVDVHGKGIDNERGEIIAILIRIDRSPPKQYKFKAFAAILVCITAHASGRAHHYAFYFQNPLNIQRCDSMKNPVTREHALGAMRIMLHNRFDFDPPVIEDIQKFFLEELESIANRIFLIKETRLESRLLSQ